MKMKDCSIIENFLKAKSFEEIKEIEDEISDRFGYYPENIKNLIELSKIKIMMKELKIKVYQEEQILLQPLTK